MAEYIEREKAIAICQSYYEHCLEMHDYCGDSVAYDIRSDIQKLPTTDVVEVVRCKDCEKWDTSNKLLNTCACTRWSQSMPYPRLTSPDDYCSYGVRKEGAEK